MFMMPARDAFGICMSPAWPFTHGVQHQGQIVADRPSDERNPKGSAQ
jgi:hypothetical protein